MATTETNGAEAAETKAEAKAQADLADVPEEARHLLTQKKELEVDKIFRALVKLEGQRLAHEGRPAADDPHPTANCGRSTGGRSTKRRWSGCCFR